MNHVSIRINSLICQHACNNKDSTKRNINLKIIFSLNITFAFEEATKGKMCVFLLENINNVTRKIHNYLTPLTWQFAQERREGCEQCCQLFWCDFHKATPCNPYCMKQYESSSNETYFNYIRILLFINGNTCN